MAKLRVWLVDDDEQCIKRIQTYVEEYGAELVLFRHPAELFDILDEEHKPPDLILLDSDPILYSSKDICTSIRCSSNAESAVIFCLCDSYDANAREVQRLVGVDGWMSRPVKPESIRELFEVIQSGVYVGFSERQDIPFETKLGQLSVGYDGENILCEGTLDENASFDSILSLLPTESGNMVGVDWSGLRNLNIQGLIAWRDFSQSEAGSAYQYLFFRCPVVMIEYCEMMPEFCGDNVTVVSVDVPFRSHIETELMDALIDSANRVAMGGFLDRTIRRQTKELSYEDFLGFTSGLQNSGREAGILFEYLPFLHLNVRHVLSEFFLTRHTILNQASQMAARFSSFDRAARSLGTECKLKPASRSAMIQCVFESYEPILYTLTAAERILNCLVFKVSPGKCQNRRRIFSDLAYDFASPSFAPARFYLKVNKVAKFEVTYDRSRDLGDLKKLVCGVYSTIHELMAGLMDAIHDIGIELLKLLESYAEVEPFVFEAAAALEQKAINIDAQELYRFLHCSLQTWEGTTSDIGAAVERASCLCLDYEFEMSRIMHSLNSHDEMNQVLEHRMVELKRLFEGAERQEIMDRIRDRAVTIIEKKIVSFSFEEFKDAFENPTETEMEFF